MNCSPPLTLTGSNTTAISRKLRLSPFPIRRALPLVALLQRPTSVHPNISATFSHTLRHLWTSPLTNSQYFLDMGWPNERIHPCCSTGSWIEGLYKWLQFQSLCDLQSRIRDIPSSTTIHPDSTRASSPLRFPTHINTPPPAPSTPLSPLPPSIHAI